MQPLLACCFFVAALPPADEPRGFHLRSIPLPDHVGTSQGLVDMVAFSPDGRFVAAAGRSAIHVWEVATGRERTRMRLNAPQRGAQLVFTADGREVVYTGMDDPAVRWFDAATGKQVRERDHPRTDTEKASARVHTLRFGPAGQWLLLREWDNDTRHGTVRSIDPLTAATRADFSKAYPSGMQGTAVTRDGACIVGGSPNYVAEVWDAKSGERLRTVGPRHRPGSGLQTLRLLALSQDDRYMAISRTLQTGRPGPRNLLEVWGLNDGRLYCSLPVPEVVTQAAFAADGRALVATPWGEGVVLYDLVRGAPAPEYAIPGRLQCDLASPDGKTLAALVWSPTHGAVATLHLTAFPSLPELLPAGGDLDVRQTAECLTMLGSANEFRGQYAATALIARPEQAVVVLAGRVAPESDRRRAIVTDLINTLGDDRPDVRDKALSELCDLAHHFEPLLNVTHVRSRSGEVKNRLAGALAFARENPPPADLTQELRAIKVLATVSTPAAKELLAKLAAGADGSRLTAEAKSALGQRGKR